ncbi:hypothetical protein H257_03318 [Aphanomyces astaci]|uniref:oligopeptidase A n=1 Tax=Aphanomyces astaci TaxID=112090 RepID=W4H394_APHAT|nr:hypothetical protein H257_03318 [Aphanomyces astaci]ETV85613.1 hypothetical protein H257_03318 [Aphanomyces astaci]|eukprot:XP_009825631.1 hypothetical protein H257_03318 [Aphanomyces astaci]
MVESSSDRYLPTGFGAWDCGLPPYQSFRAEDFGPAIRAAIDDMVLELNSMEDDLANPDMDLTWSNVMDRVEFIDDPLSRLWNVLFFLCGVVDTPILRTTMADLQAEVLTVQSRRNQSAEICRAMEALRASAEWPHYSVEQQRLLNRAILSAQLAGVRLDAVDKSRVNDIKLRLYTLQHQTFANNVSDATKAYSKLIRDKHELDGVPTVTLAVLAQNAVASGICEATTELGPWKLSLDNAVVLSILKHCTNRSLRQEVHRENTSKASANPFNNIPVIEEILALRHEEAQLLGYHTYAELSLALKMAPSVLAVEKMINDLRDVCFPAAQAELARLNDMASSCGHDSPLEPWDVAYWTEQLSRKEYAVDDEMLAMYFPLDTVLTGLFELAFDLFGIRVEAADGAAETWHPDVRFFRIRAMETPGTPVIGQFFLDPYARPEGKRHGGWVSEVVSRSKVLGTPPDQPIRVAVFNIVCNLVPPVATTTPTSMTFADVEHLFLSFAFGLRSALTCAEYSRASENNGVEWDALEIPTMLLVNFCYHRGTMQRISKHVVTGHPLSHDLFDKLVAARRFMAATKLLRQMHLSAVDMALHHYYDPSSAATTLQQVQDSIAQRFCVLPLSPDDRFLCSFGHLFAGLYAAGYYSYKWSAMLSADAYAAFEQVEGDVTAWRALGRHFRDTVLARLGVDHPLVAFEQFRGRRPSPDHLLQLYGVSQ